MNAWSLPLCTAITTPILWANVPWGIAVLEMLLIGSLVIFLHYWPFLVLIGAGHIVARWWAKWDPYFLDVAVEHLNLTGYSEP